MSRLNYYILCVASAVILHSRKRIAKAMIRLPQCADWSVPLLVCMQTKSSFLVTRHILVPITFDTVNIIIYLREWK